MQKQNLFSPTILEFLSCMLWSIWMRLGWLSVCSVPITVTKRRGWGDREGILPVWLLCQFSPWVPGSPQGFLYYPNVLHPSQQSVPIFPVQVTIIQLSTGRWRRKERACAEKGVWVESRNRPKRTTEKQRCPSILVKPCDGGFPDSIGAYQRQALGLPQDDG